MPASSPLMVLRFTDARLSGGAQLLEGRAGHLYLVLPDTGSPLAEWECMVPTGFVLGDDINLVAALTGAISPAGIVRLQVETERHQDGVTDMDVEAFGTPSTVDAAPDPTDPALVSYATLLHANPGLVEHEGFRLRLSRDNTPATNMAGHAEVYSLYMREN